MALPPALPEAPDMARRLIIFTEPRAAAIAPAVSSGLSARKPVQVGYSNLSQTSESWLVLIVFCFRNRARTRSIRATAPASGAE